MGIERELKYYFPFSEENNLISKLDKFKYVHKKHELTLNYDNPNPSFSFYDKKIDGRLRLRIMRYLDGNNKGKIEGLFSWKQRIPKHSLSKIRHEKEIECLVYGKEVKDLRAILRDVLKCPLISSYERERSHYHIDNIDITMDKFPFGLMLELEFKDSKGGRAGLEKILKKIDLDFNDASSLSCDDMYKYLCKINNKISKDNILFNDEDMPILI